MAVNIQIKSDGQIRIEGEMSIYTAAAIKQQLVQTSQGRDIEIDLSGVTEIDTAGLQLLMLMKRDAGKHNSVLRLTAHSPAVIDVFDVCNLAGYFGDPVVM